MRSGGSAGISARSPELALTSQSPGLMAMSFAAQATPGSESEAAKSAAQNAGIDCFNPFSLARFDIRF
jgi:hypothetical protein